jgi:hypothetical protein
MSNLTLLHLRTALEALTSDINRLPPFSFERKKLKEDYDIIQEIVDKYDAN